MQVRYFKKKIPKIALKIENTINTKNCKTRNVKNTKLSNKNYYKMT